ncbi:hypothetical protein RI030_01550 [Aphanizomenon flos-aquae NRERC-008]|uniref:Uncharacterized protein n=2 Tax=Aphanizomenon flos-aquae TaxID=1176 RepID=A0ABR8IVW9_APHFL|nr:MULTISPECIES: hypothetical protein [Aphanizomenon]MBD1218594.1 hypothetical protein [Aphanizomenon flos-aquae Clear-A1]MBD2390529.1 hypothetical protein [Aphanizomenon flos-aquae FACHB-1171]MBD2558510.1 hypothetical protein [Aphanizomenon flos-aquae FACHB-1290]MBD2632480.1 hypothetical protein [Aphanizomenon sp. FACHB-1399]MBD2656595.1 hypothetical protein [Aphanizomenon flos-aquae FACHB-1265]MBD2672829.1 hypothetical protein [Aphanizomenon flos-aquae FACHB-1416]MBD2686348.1 hypothetical 
MQDTDSMNDIAAALQQPADLDFELPDPEDEEILESDFLQQLDVAWQVCDRFDLQTEIWRGRILRSIRDREKKGGDGRGTGFLKWLKEREISKTQAYSWIQLANSADTLISDGKLDPDTVNNFSKRAFVETAKAVPEVQQMVSEAAQKGDRITRREVRQLSDEWTAMSSDLLPEEVREKAADNSLPPRYIAPLVKEMEKLPELHQKALQRDIAANPDVDTVKQATSEARQLAKYLKSAAQVQALIAEDVDIETALEEAQRVGCLSIAADLVNQASQIEQTIAKLYMTWKKIGNLADRLYVDTGASTPNLRSLLTCIEPLGGEIMELQLSGAIEHTIRLQIQEAS